MPLAGSVDALLLGVCADEWRLFFMIPTYGAPWTRALAVVQVAKAIRQLCPYVGDSAARPQGAAGAAALLPPRVTPPTAACERAAALLIDGLFAIAARSGGGAAGAATLKAIFGRALDGLLFFQPLLHCADAAARIRGVATYCYRVDYASRRDAASGAHHAIDLGLVFGTIRQRDISPTYGASARAAERDGTADLARRVMAAWGSFARKGVPVLPAPRGAAARDALYWPRWSAAEPRCMVLNTPNRLPLAAAASPLPKDDGCRVVRFQSAAEAALWRAVWAECGVVAVAAEEALQRQRSRY
jgi:hypothetical protein